MAVDKIITEVDSDDKMEAIYSAITEMNKRLHELEIKIEEDKVELKSTNKNGRAAPLSIDKSENKVKQKERDRPKLDIF